jgi:predicted permease
MEWDLGLPLLVMLATAIVGILIFFAGRKIMFDPRAEDGTDSVAEGGN